MNKITLELTQEELELIIQCLAQQPYNLVYLLLNKIQMNLDKNKDFNKGFNADISGSYDNHGL